jgi:DUF4097 and DUF4098 domain-containing protein YvlB
MKTETIMKNLIIMALATCMASAQAQTHQENIVKELTFESINANNTVIVENVFGNITVEGYNGNTIIVEVGKVINAETQARLEQGIKDIQLGVIDRGDTLILFTEGACHSFGKDKTKNERTGGWGYQWDCKTDCNMEFEYLMNFKIKIPSKSNMVATTVNNGDIVASKVGGAVFAQNVNGSVRLEDLTQSSYAHTINGDVTVSYTKHPQTACRFYTLNGNINANFPKGLAANVNFKSYNGEFYTNVNDLNNLPVKVEKQATGKGTKFSVSGNRFKAGGGGTLLDFETFNGNVYLKEAQ